MAIAINGSDGNAAAARPLITRDVDGSANDFIYIQGVLTPSGNYTNGTGDTVDWTTVNDKLSSGVVISASAWSQNGANNQYSFVQNAALNSWKIRMYVANVEVSTGAYPAAVTNDVIAFQLVVRKLGS